MSEGTKIEWTDATWNPIRARLRAGEGITSLGWHCERVSPGCEHCYAEHINARRFGTGRAYTRGMRDNVETFIDEETIVRPLRWRKPRRVFVGSMTDIFGEWVSDALLDRLFTVMALTPHITYQVLTKRPARMRKYVGLVRERLRARHIEFLWSQLGRTGDLSWPLPNVWLGVSVEDQRRAEERIPLLLDTPAIMRFLSCEPLLEDVDLDPVFPNSTHSADWCADLDWVIVGGESGPHARPCDVGWVRSIVRQCQEAFVPVFVKQLGARAYLVIGVEPFGLEIGPGSTSKVVPGAGELREPVRHSDPKGGDPAEWPEDLRVREFPR